MHVFDPSREITVQIETDQYRCLRQTITILGSNPNRPILYIRTCD